MKWFLSSNIHWILLFFVLVNLITGLFTSQFFKQDIIAMIFEIVGLVAVTYLAFHVEGKKRKEQQEK